MKRTLCKICGIVLKPGVSAEVQINGCKEKDQMLTVVCTMCSSSKSFVLNSKYDMWLDNPRSVVETIPEKKAEE